MQSGGVGIEPPKLRRVVGLPPIGPPHVSVPGPVSPALPGYASIETNSSSFVARLLGRGKAAGARLVFVDRGVHALTGVSEPRQLFAVVQERAR